MFLTKNINDTKTRSGLTCIMNSKNIRCWIRTYTQLLAFDFNRLLYAHRSNYNIYLSSIGAHTNQDNGLLIIHYNAEKILSQLPADVNIAFMRPVGFYKNLLGYINGIKAQDVIASNYGEDDTVLLVSATDIAAVIVEELVSKVPGRKVRYVASEELTCNQVAGILGGAIDKPDLKWIIITDEQLLNGLKAFGMNTSFAESFVVMNASTHNGMIYEDYYRKKPILGKEKLTAFAKEFAAVYHQQ